jgi:hypothetical protein
MPIVRDFRSYSFSLARIDGCGRFIGRRSYWKLYAVENVLRVFIHSALSAQIIPAWWDVAVDPRIRKNAEKFRGQYMTKPWHTLPGGHGIYYVFLSDLNRIISSNSNLFLPLVPDVDAWIAKIEEIRVPRNIVGHMNFPNEPDRRRIDKTYSEIRTLIQRLEAHGLSVQIP